MYADHGNGPMDERRCCNRAGSSDSYCKRLTRDVSENKRYSDGLWRVFGNSGKMLGVMTLGDRSLAGYDDTTYLITLVLSSTLLVG
jgi:hypothetical protein